MIGGKANMPLVAAFCCNCSANFRIVSGSAVAPMTNSTGNWPPPGSAGGVAAMVRMPGMRLTFCCTSGMIWNTVRFRSPQGLSTRPPKPLSGKVIWKVWLASGTLINSRLTASV